MRLVKSSLTLKFLLFLIGVSTPMFFAIFLLKDLTLSSKIAFFVILITFFLASFIGFVLFVIKPISRVTPQVKALLTGKKYQRMAPLSPDEIGMFTHFFNEVTRNLEKISVDLKEQRRIFSEIDVARSIQQDVLPKDATNIEGLDIIAKSKSAAEMGGDSFDFIQRDDESTLIYIGDVTGHGVPAGLVMMMVNTLMHAYSSSDMLPQEILTVVNETLCKRISSQRFMTLVMLRWDAFRRKMYYTGAGHEHILVYRAETKEVETIKSGGIALRMTPNIKAIIKEKELPLTDGDVLLLYTDGITEARNSKGEMYGIERLITSLKKHGFKSSTEKIFDKISEEFSDFIGDNYIQDDDITMIVIKQLGESEEQKKAVKLTIKTHDDTGSLASRWAW
ncbi:MAG: PP2C family protein-serine/threonine phosphatase [Candidatus Gracilibacteria bacterium]|jgi:serine phosphatase RsbU (regulator of sigma subunit)|nr:PP2C family protein-serine/threonine phosphatase [Candidatus Gracilibacteria bacterium]